jgi:hypothetical protein
MLLSISVYLTPATSSTPGAAHFVSNSHSDELYLATDRSSNLMYATGTGQTESSFRRTTPTSSRWQGVCPS